MHHDECVWTRYAQTVRRYRALPWYIRTRAPSTLRANSQMQRGHAVVQVHGVHYEQTVGCNGAMPWYMCTGYTMSKQSDATGPCRGTCAPGARARTWSTRRPATRRGAGPRLTLVMYSPRRPRPQLRRLRCPGNGSRVSEGEEEERRVCNGARCVVSIQAGCCLSAERCVRRVYTDTPVHNEQAGRPCR